MDFSFKPAEKSFFLPFTAPFKRKYILLYKNSSQLWEKYLMRLNGEFKSSLLQQKKRKKNVKTCIIVAKKLKEEKWDSPVLWMLCLDQMVPLCWTLTPLISRRADAAPSSCEAVIGWHKQIKRKLGTHSSDSSRKVCQPGQTGTVVQQSLCWLTNILHESYLILRLNSTQNHQGERQRTDTLETSLISGGISRFLFCASLTLCWFCRAVRLPGLG